MVFGLLRCWKDVGVLAHKLDYRIPLFLFGLAVFSMQTIRISLKMEDSEDNL